MRRLVDLPIIVVEDDAPSARLQALLLTLEGCDVRIADSAEAAMEILKNFRARVAIIDLILPRMSGLLLARELKATPSTTNVVIIAVSAANGAEVERLVLEAGCALYVRKPIDVDTFAGLVAKQVTNKP